MKVSAASPGPAEDLSRLQAAGHEWLRQGRGKAALAAFEAALALPDLQPEQQRSLQAAHAEAMLAAGQHALAVERLRAPVAELAATRRTLDLSDARLAIALVRALFVLREVHAIVGIIQQLLPRLRGAALADSRARLRQVLAVTLDVQGQGDAALVQHDAVVQALDHFDRPDLQRDLAAALVNRSATLWRMGRAEAALPGLWRARALLCGQHEAGAGRDLQIIAAAEGNIGAALVALDRFDEALASYDSALARMDRLLRQKSDTTDPARANASRASLDMNRAYLLFRIGRHADAAAGYRRARRRYAALRIAAPQLAEDEARVWVNQAHLLAAQGQHEAARRLYGAGWRQFKRALDAGRQHLRFDAANARLGLARCLARLQQLQPALQHFGAAQHSLAALTREGQLQRAPDWSEAVAAMAEVLRAVAPQDASAGDALLAALSQPARGSQHDMAVQMRHVEAGLVWLERWLAEPVQPAWWPRFAPGWLHGLLERTAELLGDSEPEALRQQAVPMAALVQRLGHAAMAQPDAAAAAADWFLHTRGLRAQRSALAAGSDAPLRQLRRQLARLRELEENLLAASTGATPEQATAWRHQHERCERLRESLVRRGLLPAAPRLQARPLAEALDPGQALLLLARADAQRLLLIVLVRPGHGTWARLREVRLAEGAPDALTANRLQRQSLLAIAGATALRRAADTEALEEPVAASSLSAELHLHEPLLRQGFQPLLDELSQEGRQQIVLVPSSDLHLLPFHELLSPLLSAGGGRLALYPSCGAWAQRRSHAVRRSKPSRWALLAPGEIPGVPTLPWAQIELLLCQRLWGALHWQRLDPQQPKASGVTGLIGMGHGHAPQGNVARTGMLTAPGQVLSAHELPHIRHCSSLLLSCCVLGRVDEVHNEAMGFLSSAFGYRVRFGVGWLIEVPDAEACLFSLALQHALCHGPHSKGGPAWGAAFAAVRADLAGGRWPTGFAAWLRDQLPAVIAESALPPGRWLNRYEYLRDFDGGLFEQPPPSLVRLMPWVTALGE